MPLSRRVLLSAAPALLAAGCAVTSPNGVTTVTLDTARIQQDGMALLTAATQVLGSPGIAAALGVNLATAQQALTGANSAFSSVTSAIQASVSVSLDTSSVQNGVKSLLSDIQSVLDLVQPVLMVVPGGAAVSLVVTAAQTLVPFLELAASLVGSRTAALAPGGEIAALRTIYGR